MPLEAPQIALQGLVTFPSADIPARACSRLFMLYRTLFLRRYALTHFVLSRRNAREHTQRGMYGAANVLECDIMRQWQRIAAMTHSSYALARYARLACLVCWLDICSFRASGMQDAHMLGTRICPALATYVIFEHLLCRISACRLPLAALDSRLIRFRTYDALTPTSSQPSGHGAEPCRPMASQGAVRGRGSVLPLLGLVSSAMGTAVKP